MSNRGVYLALFIDAPLQSWGHQSRFDRRTSLSWPTRSGIVGMLCAAMGIDRGDDDSLGQFQQLHMTTLVYRVDGRCFDFHTVGGGWSKSLNPQNIVKTAQGKPGNTVVTRREYLEGAKFGIILRGSVDLLETIHAALLNPRWGIWFGRKSCIPATPVCQGLFFSEDDAMRKLATLAEGDILRKIVEVDDFAEGTDTVNDNPVSFSSRDYVPRRVLT